MVVFWDIAPCSLVMIMLMIEAVNSFETCVNMCHTTCFHIPEDSRLITHHCENLKSQKEFSSFHLSSSYICLTYLHSITNFCWTLYKWYIYNKVNINHWIHRQVIYSPVSSHIEVSLVLEQHLICWICMAAWSYCRSCDM
jgi:hypothetical protein